MTITPFHPDDLQALQQRVRVESDAKARDRCRCVLLAIDGLIDRACAESWNKLTPERIKTITHEAWLEHAN